MCWALKPTGSIRSRTRLKNNLIADGREDHNISFTTPTKISAMKHSSTIICAVLATLAFGGVASAQMLPPGASRFNPLPPAPPPSPKIEAPVMPQLDAPPTQNFTSTPRPSFTHRITARLDEGAPNGLGPNEPPALARS